MWQNFIQILPFIMIGAIVVAGIVLLALGIHKNLTPFKVTGGIIVGAAAVVIAIILAVSFGLSVGVIRLM